MYLSLAVSKPVFSEANFSHLHNHYVFHLIELIESTCCCLCMLFISVLQMKQDRGRKELFHKKI